MELSGDLEEAVLAALLPDRPIRSYPALLSTEADAQAWARSGGPAGAVVAAEYQASPRGRAGLEWRIVPGEGLAFSLLVRPRLTAAREGWLYVAATVGVGDALGSDTTLEWPDEVRRDGLRVGAVGVHSELGQEGVEWAVVSVFAVEARPPRAPLLAAIVAAVEERVASPVVPVLADYLRRCDTIDRQVRARMIPLGPGGVVIAGRAANVLGDGALVIETEDGRRLAVRPQSLGVLEEA